MNEQTQQELIKMFQDYHKELFLASLSIAILAILWVSIGTTYAWAYNQPVACSTQSIRPSANLL